MPVSGPCLASHVVVLPDEIDDETAAAAMPKGMTAEYLLHRTHRLRAGETVLIHAAAGGVGLLLCQWAKALGARVIGTVSSDIKARAARRRLRFRHCRRRLQVRSISARCDRRSRC